MNHLKEFQKGIESLVEKYHIWQVFEDWTEAIAIELYQSTVEMSAKYGVELSYVNDALGVAQG